MKNTVKNTVKNTGYALLALAGLSAVTLPDAQAHKLTAAGTAYFTNPHISDEGVYQISEDNLGWGGGLLAEGSLNPYLGIELGAFYIDRKWTLSGASAGLPTETEYDSGVLHFPLMLRIYPFKHVLTLGIGGFYTRAITDIDVSTRSGGRTVASDVSYGAFNLDEDEFGVAGALGLELPFSDNFGALIEGRYLRTLTDQNANPDVRGAWRNHDFQGIVGLRFMTPDH